MASVLMEAIFPWQRFRDLLIQKILVALLLQHLVFLIPVAASPESRSMYNSTPQLYNRTMLILY